MALGGGWDTSAGNYPFMTTLQYTGSASVTQPFYIVPATDVTPEPVVDDSPLGWLRGQVDEIAELARAA